MYGKTSFGSRLRACRVSAGLSQEDVGVGIGVDRDSARTRISRYESGAHQPPLVAAIALADFFNVPLAFLYCEDDILAEVIKNISCLPRASLLDLVDQFRRTT